MADRVPVRAAGGAAVTGRSGVGAGGATRPYGRPSGADGRPVLYVIGCAAPPVLEVGTIVDAAQELGWDTCLILSPTAAGWLEADIPTLTRRTGHPVRSSYSMPGESRLLPRADAMLVAPITGNTMNKWAAGISDNLALGLLNEAICRRLPLVALPCLGRDRAHPAFPRTVSTLRGAGVTLLLPDEVTPPAGSKRPAFPWHLALTELPALPAGVRGEPAAAARGGARP